MGQISEQGIVFLLLHVKGFVLLFC
ncbi:BnaC04g52340D [Brassica napus]|uniref:BnaC04g52340D protein n=1 Tax=Brassica napus TaxID=3708 RepID=A0A078J6X7_BRANA|nr:BnaC04g52340D [Brassica napus]